MGPQQQAQSAWHRAHGTERMAQSAWHRLGQVLHGGVQLGRASSTMKAWWKHHAAPPPCLAPSLAQVLPIAAFWLPDRGRQCSGALPGGLSFPSSQEPNGDEQLPPPDTDGLTGTVLAAFCHCPPGAESPASGQRAPGQSGAGAEHRGCGGCAGAGERARGTDALCWSRSAGQGSPLPAPWHGCPRVQAGARSPGTHLGCSRHPRVLCRAKAPLASRPRPREPALTGDVGRDRTCFMGMARPLPILSALHSGTFFSRSGSAPFRDWKRRDTGPLEMGDGGDAHGPAVPVGCQRRPEQPLSPGPGLPAHGAAGVLPVPSGDSPAPASPQPGLSPHNCRQSCPSRTGLADPPPAGHTGHGDRQRWRGMQVEHGWKQERLRQ